MKLAQTIVTLFSILVLLSNCGEPAKESDEKKGSSRSASETTAGAAGDSRRFFAARDIETIESMKGLAGQEETIRPELAEQFCIHAYKLPHKADFNDEIGVLCDGPGEASQTMRDLDKLAKIVGDEPQSVELRLNHDGDFTEALFAAAYRLPIPPKWVRAGAIQEYMMRPSKFDYVTLDGEVTKDLSAQTGGDLQFGKYTMNYKTDVVTPDGKPFKNRRDTEFNAYQVHGGNPDIGIGTEHLIAKNDDYPYFKTITVTIGDDTGGSILITIINGSVRNNGYLEEAQKVFADTATAQASNVHDGLMIELKNYILK